MIILGLSLNHLDIKQDIKNLSQLSIEKATNIKDS